MPTTFEEPAERAGLQERHVREWLGAMATGGILQYDPQDRRYTLPGEHAASSTGPGAADQAPRAAMMTLLGRNLDGAAAAFRHGGGVPYSAFAPDLTGVMNDLSRRPVDELLVERLQAGARVADIGCGTGHAAVVLAASIPAPERPFEVIVAFDVVQDQVDPVAVLRRTYEALAPAGCCSWSMSRPTPISRVTSAPRPPLGPHGQHVALHGSFAGRGRGPGSGRAWEEQHACQMLAEAGFTEISTCLVPGDESRRIHLAREVAVPSRT